MNSHRVWPGVAQPLGATWDGSGVNFAIFSAHAEKVELCLFSRDGRRELARIELPEQTNQIWHGYLPDCQPGDLYGYRVYGPYEPEHGHRFNHHKLLIDPYAKQLAGELRWTDAHLGYRTTSSRGMVGFDRRDNARSMLKCVVVDPSSNWGESRRPEISWSEMVIYEAHVRGFTKMHPNLDQPIRGTFAALADHRIIDYFTRLGITSLELLPVQSFVDDRFLVEKGLRNYWGYSTLNYFAPQPRYLHGASVDEFKVMVRRLHAAGIELILDVVYNHTAEGNEFGPTFSFRGIDNASYYRLLPEDPSRYIDDTGCGNTFNTSHPRVLQLVMDSLRYWVTEMGVDGFRFDLAAAMGRESHGFDPHGGFFDVISQDPVLSQVKLIAEPWDIGPGGYQLGRFPPGWREWNDRFRDVVRRYWRGDRCQLPELAGRLHGSSDLFEHNGRQPSASINFVTSHDGFTLLDLVSYTERHNHANGEDNRDGHHANFSANYGVEGKTDDASINQLRCQQIRNFLASLLLSQGTPMLLAGDEFGRSQLGNNNAYCQDNEISWIDWSDLRGNTELFLFVQGLISLRHHHPALRRNRFQHGLSHSRSTGEPDIRWLDERGRAMESADWDDHDRQCVVLLLSGDAGDFYDRRGQIVTDDHLLIAFNAAEQAKTIKLPGHSIWYRQVDTATQLASFAGIADQTSALVAPRSVTLLALPIEDSCAESVGRGGSGSDERTGVPDSGGG